MAMPADLSIRIGITATDRTHALIDGRVSIPGVHLDLLVDEPQALFKAGQVDETLDIAEMSLGTHMLQVDSGTSAYWALPVYLSRAFRHSAIHVHRDRGIVVPADLNGRRIGIAGFQQTATIWARGMLAEHYGFDPASVTWVVGGLDRPGNLERVALRGPLRRTIEHAAPDQTLNALLLAGEIDAIISPTSLSSLRLPDSPVVPLFPDCGAEERATFARTGVFPIMHVLGIRKSLSERVPDLVAILFAAFSKSKQVAQDELLKTNYLRTCLPWIAEEAHRTMALMGANPWSYGFATNRPALEAMMRYARADGLIGAGLTPEMLFHPQSLTLEEGNHL
jgi:4,5-dihydroxyphthalate decarboxylase